MLSLLTCGYHFIHSSGIKIERPNGAGNYAFVFFKTPAFTLLDNIILNVPANSYVLYKPGTPQLYYHAEAPFINDWFHCEAEETGKFLESINFPTDTIIPAHDPLMISRCVRELGVIQRQGGDYAAKIVDADLKSLFLKLRAAYEYSGADKSYQRYYLQLARLRDEIYAFPGENRTVEIMAANVNLSRSYFQHIYKGMFGISVVNDIIASRIEYARYCLGTGQYSVNEVAKMCGYENIAHFIRQFKKHTGMTPGKYFTRYETLKGENRVFGEAEPWPAYDRQNEESAGYIDFAAGVTMYSGNDLSDDSVYIRRIEKCMGCELCADGKICMVCGYFVRFRALGSDGYCPHPGGSRWK